MRRSVNLSFVRSELLIGVENQEESLKRSKYIMLIQRVSSFSLLDRKALT